MTLAFTALLTVVIVAFFSSLTSDLKIEDSRGSRKQADLIASSGCAYVTSLFFQELVNNSTMKTYGTGGTAAVAYFPNTAPSVVPARSISSSILSTDSNYYNLIRQSVATSDSNASIDSTSQAAKNGRTVSLSRWNKPALLGGDGFTVAGQLPNWIYVDRVNGVMSSGSTNTIGRFAYNVYDIGGLLNVNAAGYPATLSAQDASFLKGTPEGADLTQLPGVTAADVADLFSFRNPSAATSSSYSYIGAAQAAERSGFLHTYFTDTPATGGGVTYRNNYFSSRQDLLRYAKTRNTNLVQALPFLTTFSRHLTAPSWIPQTPAGSTINYTTTAMTSGCVNRAVVDIRVSNDTPIAHYHDDGTTESYTVRAGDSFLQRRFSLAKLAWLTSSGPSRASVAAAIQDCFGLTWDSTNEQWIYQDTTIKALDDVAKLAREPNFFELLKAGILAGSVGVSSSNCTIDSSSSTSSKRQLEANADLQILRIGANIIDCAKEDNIPTTLVLGTGGYPVHGVVDLPYLYGVLNTPLANVVTTGTTHQTKWASLVFVPLLFNPHRSISTAPASSPTQLRISITSGTLSSMYLSGVASTSNAMRRSSLNRDMSTSTTPIVFNLNSDLFRTSMSPVSNATSVTSLSALVPEAASSENNSIHGFLIYRYDNITGSDTVNGSMGVFRGPLSNFMMVLEYKSPSTGQWRVYDTLMGNEQNPASGINNTYVDYYPYASTCVSRTSITASSSIFSKFDPRTSRYGLGFGNSFSLAAGAPIPASGVDGLRYRLPFGNGTLTTASGPYAGLWMQGGTNGWVDSNASAILNVADRDGVVRPADGWLGASGTTPGPANLFANVASGTNSARPTILHRPFRNVAELGIVFRDTPWKSLNFFDASSGDGALLDFFAVVDEPSVSSGRVSLYTRQPTVLQALLSGAAMDLSPDTASSPLQNTNAIASAMVGSANAYNFDTSSKAQGSIPFSLAQLPGFLSSTSFSTALPVSAYPIEYEREAVLRALTGNCQSRTWNLLIDVVAQSGVFSRNTSNFSGRNFTVNGEKHYWFSVAIDRYTGKIIDQQMETVNE